MNVLRAMARAAGALPDAAPASQRCELCMSPIAPTHDHVVDLDGRSLRCACRACALLFERRGAAGGRYVTVPDRVLFAAREVAAADWAALRIPVSLAFVFFNSILDRWIAVYPSPAGAVESHPDPGAMERLRRETPLIDLARPDVEAVLARGRRGALHVDLLLAPVSAGYELVARVRRQWRGFDGGDQARRAIDELFAELEARSRPAGGDDKQSPCTRH